MCVLVVVVVVVMVVVVVVGVVQQGPFQFGRTFPIFSTCTPTLEFRRTQPQTSAVQPGGCAASKTAQGFLSCL